MSSFRRTRAFLDKVSRDDVIDRSSGLAFQMLASLLPITALAYYTFAQLDGFQKLKAAAEKYALQSLAPGLSQQIASMITSVQNNVSPSTIGIFGLLGFFYAGIIMIAKIEAYLNIIWRVPTQRSWLDRSIRYAALLVFGPILLGGSLALTSFIVSGIGSVELAHGLAPLFIALPYGFSSVLFFLIYRYLPHVEVSSRAALRGGCITGLSFEILKQGFTFYSHYALTNSIYGTLATLPLLIIWISLVATIILIGGEITCYFDQPSLF